MKCTEEEAVKIMSEMKEYHLFEKYVSKGLAKDFLCTVATHIRDMQMERLLEQERFSENLVNRERR